MDTDFAGRTSAMVDHKHSGHESPSLEPRSSQSMSLDRDSQTSSSPEQESVQTEEVPGSPRVPMAWRYRQAHAEAVDSTPTTSRATYHQLHASTLHPYRRDYFKTAIAIRSIAPSCRGTFARSPKAVFPKNGPLGRGFRTLPARSRNNPSPTSPVAELSTSFYRLPKPDIPASIAGGRATQPATPRNLRDPETISIGSQFSPAMGNIDDVADYASVGNFAQHSAAPLQAGLPLPWRPGSFLPVSMLPPPFIPSQMAGNPMPIYRSDGLKKATCGTTCCSGRFIVLWLIVAVISIGVIVGVAVIFGRRNILS